MAENFLLNPSTGVGNDLLQLASLNLVFDGCDFLHALSMKGRVHLHDSSNQCFLSSVVEVFEATGAD